MQEILTVNIGGNRERLRKLASEIERACDGDDPVDLTVYCQYNGSQFDEVQLRFGNDDMEEDAAGLGPDVILVDVSSY